MSTITAKDIDDLWVKLTKAFGHKFLNNFGECDDGTWFAGLKDLTPQDIDRGFQKMIRDTSAKSKSQQSWPPNLKEFRHYCEINLADYGIPTPGVAFDEIESKQWISQPCWSHRIVELASHAMPDAKDISRGEQFAEFKKIYMELVKRYLDEYTDH